MKNLVKLFTPPILIIFIRKFFTMFNKRISLFDGINKDFIYYAKNAKIYGEYGVGLSTQFAAKELNLKTISVDSSEEWINKVKVNLNGHNNSTLININVGELGAWGRPLDYSKRENFNRYLEALWDLGVKPDFVLIDGRFRVACFLTTLLHANEDTIIAFDDYVSRPYYHVVEEVLSPFLINDRQAFFKTTRKYNHDLIHDLLSKFIYVMD